MPEIQQADRDKAAERVRNLTATDAAFANFMADSSFDSAEEMLRFIDWFDTPGRVPSGWDLTRYARAKMALSYAAQAAELSTAKAEAASLRAQHAELNAELLDLAQRYDPNCEMYVYEDQANAMDAARQTVEAMQELAEFLGRNPEGCLVDCADEAAGRIERAEDEIAELRAKLDELKAKIFEWDGWCADMAHAGYKLVDRLEEQTEGWTRPVRPIVLGATLIDELREAVKLPKALGGDENGKGKSRTPPEPGANLLCIVCAHESPWGVWDSKTGAAVCATCRDKAQFRTAAATFEDSRPVDEAWCREQFGEPTDSDDDECYWSESRAVIYFADRRCTVNIGASRIFVNPTRGQVRKLLAALKPGGA